jgi:hypothetical protein
MLTMLDASAVARSVVRGTIAPREKTRRAKLRGRLIPAREMPEKTHEAQVGKEAHTTRCGVLQRREFAFSPKQ